MDLAFCFQSFFKEYAHCNFSYSNSKPNNNADEHVSLHLFGHVLHDRHHKKERIKGKEDSYDAHNDEESSSPSHLSLPVFDEGGPAI